MFIVFAVAFYYGIIQIQDEGLDPGAVMTVSCILSFQFQFSVLVSVFSFSFQCSVSVFQFTVFSLQFSVSVSVFVFSFSFPVYSFSICGIQHVFHLKADSSSSPRG
jgi:hypothetical protein